MNEFDTLQSAPVLTLEPFAEEVVEVVEPTKQARSLQRYY